MRVRASFAILTLVLWVTPVQGGVASRCVRWLGGAVWSWLTPAPAKPYYDEPTTRALKEWIAPYGDAAGVGGRNFTRESLWLALAELPRELRRELVRPALDGSYRPGEDLAERLSAAWESVGLGPWNTVPLWLIHDSFRFVADPELAWLRMEANVAEAESWDDARKNAIREEFILRRTVDAAKDRLGDRLNPEYRIRFEGSEIVLPDGKRYTYRNLLTGGVRIWVRYRDILRSQDFESTATVTQYIGMPGLGRGGFVDAIGPDGRIQLADQHHRTKAYALRYTPEGGSYEDTLLPFNLYPAADGYYYTATHWAVLGTHDYFTRYRRWPEWGTDPTWSFLDDDKRRELIEAIHRSPIEAVRPVYYRVTGFEPLK